MAFDVDAFMSVPCTILAMVFALGTLIAGLRRRPVHLVLALALISFILQLAAFGLSWQPLAPMLGAAITCVGLVVALLLYEPKPPPDQ